VSPSPPLCAAASMMKCSFGRCLCLRLICVYTGERSSLLENAVASAAPGEVPIDHKTNLPATEERQQQGANSKKRKREGGVWRRCLVAAFFGPRVVGVGVECHGYIQACCGLASVTMLTHGANLALYSVRVDHVRRCPLQLSSCRRLCVLQRTPPSSRRGRQFSPPTRS
jgi:hypothetical protein